MSILKYFQTWLPNPEQSGFRERATTSANNKVSKQLKLIGGKKRKAYIAVSERIERRYAAESGKNTALKNLSKHIN